MPTYASRRLLELAVVGERPACAGRCRPPCREEHDRELEALGGVQRHERDDPLVLRLLAVRNLVGVRHQRHLLEEVLEGGHLTVSARFSSNSGRRPRARRGSRCGSRPGGRGWRAARRGTPSSPRRPRAGRTAGVVTLGHRRSSSRRAVKPLMALTERVAMAGASSGRPRAAMKGCARARRGRRCTPRRGRRCPAWGR